MSVVIGEVKSGDDIISLQCRDQVCKGRQVEYMQHKVFITYRNPKRKKVIEYQLSRYEAKALQEMLGASYHF